MADTFTNLLYHLVFSTKNRQPLITEDVRERLYQYMGGIIRGEGGSLLEIGGVPDHVHLLARFKPDVSVSEMIKRIKSKSSQWLNEQPGRSGLFY
jgi:REP element-mobilizing transposase RayT